MDTMMVHVKRARRVNMKVVNHVKTVRMVNTVRRLQRYVHRVRQEDMDPELINTLHLIIQITPLHVQVVRMVHTKIKQGRAHVKIVLLENKGMGLDKQVKVLDVVYVKEIIIKIKMVKLTANIRLVVTLPHLVIVVIGGVRDVQDKQPIMIIGTPTNLMVM